MIRNKFFVKFICVLLLASFLALGVGKVQRASAIGTTIAVASGAALLTVGIAYCSYMILTNASVHVPDSIDNIQTWLTDMGNDAVQYPSGREIYNEYYKEYLNYPSSTVSQLIHDFVDGFTWTADRLKSFANDFSNTGVISDIAEYVAPAIDQSQIAMNGFSYPYTFVSVPGTILNMTGISTFEDLVSRGYTLEHYDGVEVIFVNNPTPYATIYPTSIRGTYRNYFNGSRYYVQQLIDDSWVNVTPTYKFGFTATKDEDVIYLEPSTSLNGYYRVNTHSTQQIPSYGTRPLLPDAAIYDATTEQYLPTIPISTDTIVRPEWPDLPVQDDDIYLPAPIPYVQVPFDPTWIDPITGTGGGGNWGFNLGDFLDKLEDLSNTLIGIGVLADLINDFKNSLTGTANDSYYIYYDDSSHDYYEYYTITNYGDTSYYYYNYDIDVSKVDEHLPVDLNTISNYTRNRYIDTVKNAAERGSSIVGDLVVFWHNVDPDIIYILFGCAIITIIAAFIGKWGHS